MRINLVAALLQLSFATATVATSNTASAQSPEEARHLVSAFVQDCEQLGDLSDSQNRVDEISMPNVSLTGPQALATMTCLSRLTGERWAFDPETSQFVTGGAFVEA